MPIPVKNNGLYSDQLINQKYAPLDINNVGIDVAAEQEYKRLFTQRMIAMQNLELLPRPLTLVARDWEAIRVAEGPGALPPVVVVSSNRAQWIRKTWESAQINHDTENFAGVNDWKALLKGPTAWYLPQRINNANRHVYIVVHRTEYQAYRDLLGDDPDLQTKMTVIGWEFVPDPQNRSYVGFGASRFAALEFCKYVFNTLLDPPRKIDNQKAWLVDDNLVHVRRFPNFEDVEQQMTGNVWGFGFQAATVNSDTKDIRDLANDLKDGKWKEPADLANPAQTGVLQQCVLWNVGQLNSRHLNFSPYFITSNEDISLSSVLEQNPSRLRLCKGATIVKGTPDSDEDGSVATLRDHAVNAYYQNEQNIEVVGPGAIQGKQLTLAQYVSGFVLPKTPMVNENPQNTVSKAVEQLMAKIVKEKFVWVPTQIFKPNGNEPQVVAVNQE